MGAGRGASWRPAGFSRGALAPQRKRAKEPSPNPRPGGPLRKPKFRYPEQAPPRPLHLHDLPVGAFVVIVSRAAYGANYALGPSRITEHTPDGIIVEDLVPAGRRVPRWPFRPSAPGYWTAYQGRWYCQVHETLEAATPRKSSTARSKRTARRRPGPEQRSSASARWPFRGTCGMWRRPRSGPRNLSFWRDNWQTAWRRSNDPLHNDL